MRLSVCLILSVLVIGSISGCSVFSPTVARSTSVVKPKTHKRPYEPGKDKKKQGTRRVKMY
jgi:hypothetical protein